MPTRDELIRKRKKELLSLGYKPGIVDLAMEWAAGCAEGMTNYVTKAGLDQEGNSHEKLLVKFLPQYLNDSERWIRSFSHEPGEVKPIT